MKKLSLINFLFWINHPRTREIDNPPSSPFVKGGITTPPFSNGRLGGIFFLRNFKGISVIFLIIAMLLMITIGYVFSYLIPSKQKSVVFPIQSTQAFFIAQSGVEFAVRYAADQGWSTPATLVGLNAVGVNQRDLGAGGFTITYVDDVTYPDTLFSVGEVPTGTARRSIRISNFTSFLPTLEDLTLDLSFQPCLATVGGVHVVRFQIISSSGITLDSFQSTWKGTPASARLRYILMDGSIIYGPLDYRSGRPPTPFSSPQTIPQNSPVMVEIQFSRTFNSSRGPQDLHVIFYSTSGESYDLNLDPDSDGFPAC